jgi:hypothetical protein
MPAGADYPLIADPLRIRDTVVEWDAIPRVEARPVIFTEKNHAYVKLERTLARMATDRLPRWMHIDASLSFDSYSIVCGHTELTAAGPTTKFDFVLRVVPPALHEIHYPSMVEFLYDLTNVVRVSGLSFDRWNTADVIQRLRGRGVNCVHFSPKGEHWAVLRDDLAATRVRLLPPKKDEIGTFDPERGGDPFPWLNHEAQRSGAGVAITELLALERDPDSGRVYNKAKGQERGVNSDDTAQGICSVHWHLRALAVGLAAASSREEKKLLAGQVASAWTNAVAGTYDGGIR